MRTDELEEEGSPSGIHGALLDKVALLARAHSQQIALEDQARELSEKNKELERLTEELRRKNEDLQQERTTLARLADKVLLPQLFEISEQGSRRIQEAPADAFRPIVSSGPRSTD